MQKILTFFQQQITAYLCVLNFNEMLTNGVVNFEQPTPVFYINDGGGGGGGSRESTLHE